MKKIIAKKPCKNGIFSEINIFSERSALYRKKEQYFTG